MKVLMHALAASCEELRARTGNPPLRRLRKYDLVIGTQTPQSMNDLTDLKMRLD
jgi:hypothetical protein